MTIKLKGLTSKIYNLFFKLSPGFLVKYGLHTRDYQYTKENMSINLLLNRRAKTSSIVKDLLGKFRMIYFFICLRDKLLGMVYKLDVVLENWLKTRLLSVAIAQPDIDVIKACEDSFHYLRNKLPKVINVKYRDVLNWDRSTILQFALSKTWFVADAQKFYKALEGTVNNFGFNIVHPSKCCFSPISKFEAIEKLPQDTSSCYPIFKKKSHKESVKNAFELVDNLFKIKGVVNKYRFLCNFPVVVFHRIKSKLKKGVANYNIDSKIRLVFGMSFGIVLFETMIFDKVLNYIKDNGFGHSIGFTRPMISKQVRNIRYKALTQNRKIFCTDITGMDKNLPAVWIMLFFALLISVIRLPVTIVPNVVALACYHVFTPILSSRLDLVISDGGNKSGSKLTTYLNTFCVVTAINYIFLRYEGRLPTEDEFAVVGDDSIFLVDEENIPNIISDFASMGLMISSSKSTICNPRIETMPILYLGFYWNNYFQPWQEDVWWISRIAYPEQFIYVEKGVSVRLLRLASVLYQIIGGHSIFCKIMRNLGFNLKEIFSKDPKIYYLDKAGRTCLGIVPLSLLTKLGWTCY